MESSITIKRCRIVFVRRGGWRWGASCRDLAQWAMQGLPELIARRIQELAGSEVDVEIDSPLRIDVSISQRLLMDSLTGFVTSGSSTAALSDLMVSRIGYSIRRSLLPVINHNQSSIIPRVESLAATINESRYIQPANDAGCLLINLLIQFRRNGALAPLLLRLSPQILTLWHDVLAETQHLGTSEYVADLRRTMGIIGDFDSESSESALPTVESIVQRFSKSARNDWNTQTVLRYRIATMVEILVLSGRSLTDQIVQSAIERYLPLATAGRRELNSRGEETVARARARKSLLSEPTHNANRLAQREQLTQLSRSLGNPQIHITSVLPFLLLRPLADMRYLDTLGASLEAAGISDLAPAFAAALAYKVLEPPHRNWRRSPGVRKTASAFAGVLDEVPDSSPYDLASQADGFVSALNAVLAHAVTSGRESDQPLFISRVETKPFDAYFLSDIYGMFPIAMKVSKDEILELLGHCESALLLLEANAANPQFLADLNSRGHRFLISVPPTRQESLRIIRGKNRGRWWTNDAVTSPVRLAKQADRLANAAHSASKLVTGICSERRAIPNAIDRQLENSLAHAASTALAQIAWDLWRDRELTDSMLALERFADLDASVQFTNAEVRVRLPLGRRSMDLWDHGLLQDVVGVPWLGNRIVTFSKG